MAGLTGRRRPGPVALVLVTADAAPDRRLVAPEELVGRSLVTGPHAVDRCGHGLQAEHRRLPAWHGGRACSTVAARSERGRSPVTEGPRAPSHPSDSIDLARDGFLRGRCPVGPSVGITPV